MNAISYKGYVGIFDYQAGDEEFHGTVVGMKDIIHFCGRSIDELRTSLAEGVENYLELCAKRGETPEKSFSGKLSLRLDPDLHRRAALAAQLSGKSLNAWLAEVIQKEAQNALQPML